jgi:pyrrolidone-carboxylate peptidase
LSCDAGRYLCNYAYWQALQHARIGKPLIAFVHIPRIRLTPARTGKHHAPSLPQLVGAAEAILIALVSAQRSITAHRSA